MALTAAAADKTPPEEAMLPTGTKMEPMVPVPKTTKIAAWVCAGIYISVALLLLVRFGLGDGAGGNWERALTIFNALSAIGFAAVGVLLGTTVQQVNVANAQKEAVEAKTSEGKAKTSESNLAVHSEKLSKAAQELLSKTSGLSGLSLWSGNLHDPAEEELLQAIMNMNKVLAQRAVE